MYVTVTLDHLDDDTLTALAADLRAALGARFDGLLARTRTRAEHYPWAEIHTANKGPEHRIERTAAGGRRSATLELIQTRLPQVEGITLVEHYGGISHKFSDGWTRYA